MHHSGETVPKRGTHGPGHENKNELQEKANDITGDRDNLLRE